MAVVMEKKISIGEYNMNKIAICVSGQTRHFNDAPQLPDFIRVNGPGDDNKPNKKWRMQ
jgi:hypothetical protein